MQGQIIDTCGKKACDSIVRRFDNGFPPHVERSVQQHGNARDSIKFLEQSVKTFILVLSNRLHACRAVDVNDCWDLVSPLRADALDNQHERRFFISLKNFAGIFGKNDWRKWPECLPVLDPLVQLVFHLRHSWVREDTAVAERAWPEFRAA